MGYAPYVSGESADVTILPTAEPCANLSSCPATRVAASGAHAALREGSVHRG